MVAIAPQSDIILLQVPLQLNQEHQLNFASATAQYNYFNSLPKLTEYNATYMRKDGIIRYEANYEDLVGYNYVMYRNEAYGNRWFYAFITDMEYVNDNMTNIYIKTDVWQTWQFSLTWKDTFVEREHTNNDAIGNNTVPEGLEIGEYIRNGTVVNANITQYLIVFQVNKLQSPINQPASHISRSYNGIYNGLYLFAVDSEASANAVIKLYDSNGVGDNIVSIFVSPRSVFTANGGTTNIATIEGVDRTIYWCANTSASYTVGLYEVNRPTTIDGYTPKNNKLHVAPYSYIYATNNCGQDVEYHWEDFTNPAYDVRVFTVVANIGQGTPMFAYPNQYKHLGAGNSFSYGLTGARLPVCAWSSDYYLNYMAQNNFNIASGVGMGIVSGIASMASGNVFGGASSMLNSVFGAMGEVYKAERTPSSSKGNVNNSDVTFSTGKSGFTFIPMSIKAEYARQVDDYFSMFGYATHRVKRPNITGRRNWNYVKTIGCFIQTTAPQEDVQELEEMFNRGVTIWHNPATFMDYSQSNPIV